MYFPNYYEPGILNWTRVAFVYIICLPYAYVEIVRSYQKTADDRLKKQYVSLLVAMIVTSAIGFIANFLVYNIQVDPLWATAFLVMFSGIFVYGTLKYELFDIKVVAKQAFLYSIAITVIGGFIMLFDYTSRIIQTTFYDFPIWITPFISSFFIIAIAGSVWRKLRESDILKYEFVTTVTHKFRTPLTHIKWAAENLSHSITSLDDRVQLNYIQSSNEKLVELTSLLMNISEAENSDYEYKISKHSLSELVKEVADGLTEQYEIKKIKVMRETEDNLYADFDESRIKFIVQTFIENAIHYTPEGGTITITLKTVNNYAEFSVKDSGIGIAADELPRLFTKFYRGHNARLTDTEGMGIGLYMSKEIMAKHNGKIWATSEGTGLGSKFSFSLKLAR
jgi:signal transduction histidine kinase